MDDSFKFSSALRILNTNDYLAPSKSCIKSKDGQSKTQDQQVQINDLHLDSANISTSKKIQISLNDCLACSGCVTTSENMLIEAQNVQEFFRLLDLGRDPSSSSPFRIFVISVSSQALSSIAASTRNSLMEVYFKLHTLFIDKLHCDFFFDTNLSQDIALLECQLEFLESFKQTTTRPALPILTSACPGWVCYAEKTHGSWILPHLSLVKSPQQILGTLVKLHLVQRLNDHRDDILCSGIEKSLFPIEPRNICHVTLMQCFDKKLEASRSDFYNKSTDAHDVDLVLTPVELDQILSHIGLTFNELVPSDISKPFFNHLGFATVSSLDAEFSADTRNLSSVLSKGPKESSSDANRRDTLVERDIYGQDCANQELRQNTRLFGVSGSSGSFAEHVFRRAALELFGVLVDDVPFKQVRNHDLRRAELSISGRAVLEFATAYGFRNLQTIVKQIKNNTCSYQYIEIMACPDGCLNGGGQLKQSNMDSGNCSETVENQVNLSFYHTGKKDDESASLEKNRRHLSADLHPTLGKAPTGSSFKSYIGFSRTWLNLVTEKYLEGQDTNMHHVTRKHRILKLYEQLGFLPGSESAKKLLYTEYHHLPKAPDEVDLLSFEW